MMKRAKNKQEGESDDDISEKFTRNECTGFQED